MYIYGVIKKVTKLLIVCLMMPVKNQRLRKRKIVKLINTKQRRKAAVKLKVIKRRL